MSKEMTLNTVTFALTLVPENAGKIDAINKIILGDTYTTEAPAKTKSETSKPKTETKAAKPPAKEEKSGMDFAAFKKVVSAAKKEHGEDFVMSMLEEAGYESKGTLLKTVTSVEEDEYETIAGVLQEGPTKQAADEPEDDLDDDGFDDDEPYSEDIDPEAVKTALRAKAKEDRDEAKAIMTKHGAATLSKVADLSQDKLAAIMKELA